MPGEQNTPALEPKPDRGFHRVLLPLKKTLLHNFLGGIAWGLGTVLGATVLVAVGIYLFNQLGGIPFLGSLLDGLLLEVRESVEETNLIPSGIAPRL